VTEEGIGRNIYHSLEGVQILRGVTGWNSGWLNSVVNFNGSEIHELR
jgi:hypothetical protein